MQVIGQNIEAQAKEDGAKQQPGDTLALRGWLRRRCFTGAVLRDRIRDRHFAISSARLLPRKLSARSTHCRAALNSSSLPWNKARPP